MDDELAQFCRREHPRLVSAVDLVTGSFPLAEDLAQEALARVCREWGRVREMESPGGYAHRIAMNLATSSFRRRAAERRLAGRLGNGQPTAYDDPDPAVALAVRQSLQALRLEQRKVLVLRYFLAMSVAETAEVLQMPEGTVKTHASRGLSAMRASLSGTVHLTGTGVDRA